MDYDTPGATRREGLVTRVPVRELKTLLYTSSFQVSRRQIRKKMTRIMEVMLSNRAMCKKSIYRKRITNLIHVTTRYQTRYHVPYYDLREKDTLPHVTSTTERRVR